MTTYGCPNITETGQARTNYVQCAEKAQALLESLLHDDLSVANAVWFLGNDYTGAYHDILGIAHTVQHHDINKKLIAN